MPNVYTNRTFAGAIDRQTVFTRFTYAQTAAPEHVVSLTMPPEPNNSFTTEIPKSVHPVFAMNLPEGALREEITHMFAKTFPDIDDLTLLEIIGRSQIGRLRYAMSLSELDSVPDISLSNLLKAHGTDSLFRDLLQRYASYSGVAGVQPKVLVRDNGSLEKRITVPGATHIVKFFDAAAFPALAANEYLCLMAAKEAGIPVPEVSLSNDCRCLVVERFDANPDGTYKAFEDCCALDGRQPNDKYVGTYENVAKKLASVIVPQYVRKDMADFFRSIVLSMIVRNGDAHRKNFGVLYDHANNVRLSPAYDIITSTVYLPRDEPALLLLGSRRWLSEKKLLLFATNHCLLARDAAKSIIDQVAGAVENTRGEFAGMIERAANKEEQFALTTMLNAWEDGLRHVRGQQTRSLPASSGLKGSSIATRPSGP